MEKDQLVATGSMLAVELVMEQAVVWDIAAIVIGTVEATAWAEVV